MWIPHFFLICHEIKIGHFFRFGFLFRADSSLSLNVIAGIALVSFPFFLSSWAKDIQPLYARFLAFIAYNCWFFTRISFAFRIFATFPFSFYESFEFLCDNGNFSIIFSLADSSSWFVDLNATVFLFFSSSYWACCFWVSS